MTKRFLRYSSPMLEIAEYKHIEYFDGTMVPACHTLANTFWAALYFLSSIFLFFIVPLVVLMILYCVIAKNLISNAATLVLNKHIDSYSIRARRQVILMLGTVVLSFFLCLIPFRVFTLWIIIVPDETVNQLGIEKYYNILYFCRIMVYLNSAVNPILYNLMSSKFRTGFIICSETKRQLYFKRSRNGTFSTTANSVRSSTRNSEGYRVCYRPRNNSILIKNCNDSPDSNRSTESQSNSPRNKIKRYRNKRIDEELQAISQKQVKNDFEKVLIYPHQKKNLERCFENKRFVENEERINLQEKFIKENKKNEEESFV